MGWNEDLKVSSRIFLSTVWPAIHGVCGEGELRPVEVLDDSQIARDLDILAGIDVWQVCGKQGCRGIASRVQYEKAWNTFTIRFKRESGATTEYEKRLEALATGKWIYPFLTVQAYVKSPTSPILLSAGVVKTQDLYEYTQQREDHGPPLKHNTATDGTTGQTAEFIVVPWADMNRDGYRVAIRPKPQPDNAHPNQNRLLIPLDDQQCKETPDKLTPLEFFKQGMDKAET